MNAHKVMYPDMSYGIHSFDRYTVQIEAFPRYKKLWTNFIFSKLRSHCSLSWEL